MWKEQACSMPHALFLGPLSDMDLILEAMRKVRENALDLKQA